jgi:adhesin transport system outer membrane protein
LALLFIAILIPGPRTTAAQETTPKPPGRPVTNVSGDQRPAAQEKPAWNLDRLVNEAVTANPETLSKRASLEAAEASVDAAFQQFFPTPYSQINQGYDQNQDKNSAYAEQRVGTFGVRQPIWTGGKLTADLDIAKATALSADSSITETQLSLAQRVVAAYQNLMLSHGRINAQAKGLELLENYAAMMDRRVQSSVSAPVDKELVDSRISQARSDLSSFKTGEQTALAQLGQLLGRPLKISDIEFDESASLATPRESDEILQQAMQTNPTLRRMDADIKTVIHQEEKQKAALMPTLSVRAEYKNGLFDKGPTKEDTLVYTTIDFTPGAGLSSLANIRSATSRVSASKQAKEAARRDLTAKIQADYDDCLNAFTRHRLIGKTVQSSQEVLESYTRMFIAGKRSWLDVLNAARELTQNELIMADILAVYQASTYRLRLYAGETAWLQERK